MLPNERFALACRAYYDEIGLVVDASNGEFAHSPLTRKECDTGYYLLHGHHQHQGLLQSKDLGKCCFFSGHTKKWLEELDYFPDDYFGLWGIWEEYTGDNGRKTMEKLHGDKDAEGKSLHALRLNEKIHKEKDENGKSLHALKMLAQVWESTVDGFRSNAGAVARHNNARGWDPNARIRVK
jgi:hypothetical protein